MKILITGASGLLAANISYLYTQKSIGKLLLVSNNNTTPGELESLKIDFAQSNFVSQLKKSTFDVIIHCAALTNVEYCEAHPEECDRVNFQATVELAKVAKEKGALFVFISSDQIFDGTKEAYTESDKPTPINQYGLSKVKAEEGIRELGVSHLILRTNMFGINYLNKNSFSEWILECLKKQIAFTLYDNIYFNPLLVNTIADLIHKLMQIGATGTYNVTSDQRISKYEFGIKLSETFSLTPTFERGAYPLSSSRVKRPQSMYLKNTKIKQLLSLPHLDVEEEIKKLYDLYATKYDIKLKKGEL